MNKKTIITLSATIILASSGLTFYGSSHIQNNFFPTTKAQQRDIAAEAASYIAFAESMLDYLQSLKAENPSLNIDDLSDDLNAVIKDFQAATTGSDIDTALTKLDIVTGKIDSLDVNEGGDNTTENNDDLATQKLAQQNWLYDLTDYLYSVEETNGKYIDDFLLEVEALENELDSIDSLTELNAFAEKANQLYEDIIEEFDAASNTDEEKEMLYDWVEQTIVWIDAVTEHEISDEEKNELATARKKLQEMEQLLNALPNNPSREDFTPIYELSIEADDIIITLFPPLTFDEAKKELDLWIKDLESILSSMKEEGENVDDYIESIEGNKFLASQVTNLSEIDSVFSSLISIEEDLIEEFDL